MAEFTISFEKTMGHEGAYANHPRDLGRETYRGISRRFHPDWLGWSIIDSRREDDDFPNGLIHSVTLNREVENFYRHECWRPIGGDDIPDQWLADIMFDASVHMHPRTSVRHLQRALNVLNRSDRPEPIFPDLWVDGRIGAKTLAALAVYLSNDPVDVLVFTMVLARGSHHLARLEEEETQEAFTRGWVRRLMKLVEREDEKAES